MLAHQAPCLSDLAQRPTSEAGIALLDRVTEIGLLTAYGNGYYAIHPALPWYFKSLFEQYYTTDEHRKQATRAFVEAMGWLGTIYHNRYGAGNGEVINVLHAEENNLLYGWRLARTHKWWASIITTMQGLRMLYIHTGRRVEWRHLVEEIVPDFVGANDGPLPGREESWSLVIEYRVLLAHEARQLVEAERLQQIVVDWDRQQTQPVQTLAMELLDSVQQHTIRSLAASLHTLGQIQRELGQEKCVASYQESLKLSEQIGERVDAAACAFNLGHAYKDIFAIRDLEQAERWYRRSLGMYEESQRHDRGQCLVALGTVAYERFTEALSTNHPETELLKHLNAGLQSYMEALELLPVNAVNDLAVTHNQLGNIFHAADDLARALTQWHESIRYREAANNIYGAGQTRFNIAVALAQHDRFDHALLYAQAALRNFETYGAGAAADIKETQQLIAAIEEAMRGEGAEGAASD